MSEGRLSLDAELAHPPFGDRRAGQSAYAVTTLTSAAAFVRAAGTGSSPSTVPGSCQLLPSSVVTLSDVQVAKIKG
jgi:hypothetical protein